MCDGSFLAARRKDTIPNTPIIEAVSKGRQETVQREHTVIAGSNLDLVCNVTLDNEGHGMKLIWHKNVSVKLYH